MRRGARVVVVRCAQAFSPRCGSQLPLPSTCAQRQPQPEEQPRQCEGQCSHLLLLAVAAVVDQHLHALPLQLAQHLRLRLQQRKDHWVHCLCWSSPLQ